MSIVARDMFGREVRCGDKVLIATGRTTVHTFPVIGISDIGYGRECIVLIFNTRINRSSRMMRASKCLKVS